VFGPVPSRRLGRSLGVNNLPHKICSYNCIYCQAGRTVELTIDRRVFYDPYRLVGIVNTRVSQLLGSGEHIDYITFVPNGEPTLDKNIGVEARLLKNHGIPLAILTNGSLLHREDVRTDLTAFNYVSIKVDAVSERIWRIVNRPHPSLKIDRVLEGILEFRRVYRGKLVTETMLLGNIDYSRELERIADYLHQLKPDIAYIAAPTRPPAEEWVKPPSEELLNHAYQLFSEKIEHVELLTGFEGTHFTVLDDVSREILSITSVHPLREDILEDILARKGCTWDVVEDLVRKGLLARIHYAGYNYYIRKISK